MHKKIKTVRLYQKRKPAPVFLMDSASSSLAVLSRDAVVLPQPPTSMIIQGAAENMEV